ncbi:MAG: hypothetical protein H6730_00685 [Deltaproteobacteria bacterium]|nr:hypothetical protein [Deltaproteobacteria bacterium]
MIRIVAVFITALLGLAACTEPAAPEPEPAPPEIVLDYEEPIGPEPPPIHEYHVGEIRNGDSLSPPSRVRGCRRRRCTSSPRP